MAVQYGNVDTFGNLGERAYVDCTPSETGDTYTLNIKAGIQAYTSAISLGASSGVELYVNLASKFESDTAITSDYSSVGVAYSLAKNASRQHFEKALSWSKSKESTQTVQVCVFSTGNTTMTSHYANPLKPKSLTTTATSSNSSIKTLSFTIPMKSSYTISFNANGGTGTAPADITKWHNEPITLPANTLTRTGYDFVGWGTSSSGGTVFQPDSSYNGNATVTLYAIWKSNYVAPTISNLVAYRSTSSGIESDDDTYAKVTFNYTEPELDHATYSSYSIKVGYKQQSASTYTYQTVTGSSGTVDAILSNIDAEHPYDIQAVISPTGFADVTRNTYVSEAYYVIDINADGTGIAFGQASTEEGFVCAMKIPNMIGFIQMFAGTESAVPPMWKMCNGQALNRTEYADLFAVIGTTYGTGDGSTTFNLPDLRDRFAVGAGSSYALNATGGSTTHHHTTGDFTLEAKHIPAHTHGQKTLTGTIRSRRQGAGYQSFWTTGIASVAADTANKVTSNGVGTTNQTSDTVTINATHTHDSVGGGQAHNHGNTGDSDNRPPYIGINYIIYAGK